MFHILTEKTIIVLLFLLSMTSHSKSIIRIPDIFSVELALNIFPYSDALLPKSYSEFAWVSKVSIT